MRVAIAGKGGTGKTMIAGTLARLIGRRPDAEAVFRAAGRFIAKEAYMGIAPKTRRIML